MKSGGRKAFSGRFVPASLFAFVAATTTSIVCANDRHDSNPSNFAEEKALRKRLNDLENLGLDAELKKVDEQADENRAKILADHKKNKDQQDIENKRQEEKEGAATPKTQSTSTSNNQGKNFFHDVIDLVKSAPSAVSPCLKDDDMESPHLDPDMDVEPSATAFGNGRITAGDGSALAIVQVAQAFAPMFKENCKGLRLGLGLAVATPVESSNLEDYGRQQLLLDDGGLVTATFSLSRSLASVGPKGAWADVRAGHTDRLYLRINVTDENGNIDRRDSAQLWSYVVNGLAAKAIRTQIDGDIRARAQGTAYIGLGFDGPLFETSQLATPAGGIDVQGKIAANVINKDSLQALYGTENRYSSFYLSGGVSATAYIVGKVNLSFEYQAALTGRNRRVLDSVAMFSIGYNNGSAAEAGAE